MKKNNILEITGICIIIAAIVGGILNCLILPIGYIFTHDCGKFFCNHSYPMTWGAYAIVTGIVFVPLFLVAIIAENTSDGKSIPPRRSNRTYYRRNNQTHNNSKETDYYDSDMEGAPGYNGFD